jgi:hypothetical protein
VVRPKWSMRPQPLGEGNNISVGGRCHLSFWCSTNLVNTMQNQLSIRVNANNPNHHLWNNHGVWWIHYTVLIDGAWQQRVRHSLGTKDRAVARRKRDRILAFGRGVGDSGRADVVRDASKPRASFTSTSTRGLRA